MPSRPYSKSPASTPGSQTALANLAGVTQARVSTIVRDLASALDTALKRLPGAVIVSGDVAADAANVVLEVTDDPVVAAEAHEAEWRGRTFLAADPLRVLWNLESAPGTEAAQAADHWRTHVVRGPRCA